MNGLVATAAGATNYGRHPGDDTPDDEADLAKACPSRMSESASYLTTKDVMLNAAVQWNEEQLTVSYSSRIQ